MLTRAKENTSSNISVQGLLNAIVNLDITLFPVPPQVRNNGKVIIEKMKRYTRNHR